MHEDFDRRLNDDEFQIVWWKEAGSKLGRLLFLVIVLLVVLILVW